MQEPGPGNPENTETIRRASDHNILMNCVIRVIKHLGCPQGCSDGIRGAQADFCRSQAQSILTRLHKASPKLFSKLLRILIRDLSIHEILDFFHSYVGFCIEPSSLLSPLSKLYSFILK